MNLTEKNLHYSQHAIINFNKLIKLLRDKLKNQKNANTAADTVSLNKFSLNTLTDFISNSMVWFNETPMLTCFNFEDDEFIDSFGELVTQGAFLMMLASQALLERDQKEFIVNDDQEIEFTIPTVSELLATQWSDELQEHVAKIKHHKSLQCKFLSA